MADKDVNKAENFMNNLNRLEQPNENIDEILSNLLSSSLAAPPAEDLNDLDDITCEYTDLNNTIDALNSYLDVWEERHRSLKEKVREALLEGETEDAAQQPNSSQDSEQSSRSSNATSNHKSIQGPEKCNDPAK